MKNENDKNLPRHVGLLQPQTQTELNTKTMQKVAYDSYGSIIIKMFNAIANTS